MSEIKDWIREQIDAGFTNEQIRDSLQSSGYPPQLLDEVLEERSNEGGISGKILITITIFLVTISVLGYFVYSWSFEIPGSFFGFIGGADNNESTEKGAVEYAISNCEELQKVQNNLSEGFELTGNIDCSETANWNNGKGFNPIGGWDDMFDGVFLGRGHDITGLYINRPNETCVGLFGVTGMDAAIKNVSVVDVDLNGESRVGGLTGVNNGEISYSNANGNVNGSWRIGGLIGANNVKAEVSYSYATGEITGFKSSVGGLVGNNWGKISDSYSTGEVSGNESVGGLAGLNSEEGKISDSYSTGEVTGEEEVGGLVGFNNGNISDSFWDTEVSGMNESEGGTGLTTSEMQIKSTFTEAGWDFEDTWYMDEYPDLQWNQ